MNRDPFYQQIIGGLAGSLDPELFEQCAADILRDELPTLVPVRGGSDAGMDAAIADLQGTAYPLICTTGTDVIGNLTRNLKRYKQEGHTRRRVVLATSQQLTAKRRSNLEKRSFELGFELVQIYDQAAFADRLYRNSAWCLELLNLTGAPPALSVLPQTKRPLVGNVLVGRDPDMKWLRTTAGDRLLIGQPGTGKTSLLYLMSREGGALFLIDDAAERIANDFRSQNPSVVIVDDAHVHLEKLEKLCHIRMELRASFDIIATCWPGSHKRVAEALSLPESRVRKLDLLTRDEIVEVVRSTGIAVPDSLIREIVDQAEGRPGLAVTLASLCLQDGLRDVVLGDALARSLHDALHLVAGEQGVRLLAAFALGDAEGMPMTGVGAELGISLVTVSTQIAELGYGGVVSERVTVDGRHRIVVRPQALRHVLVRDVFFRGPGRLSYEPFMKHAADLSDIAHTLIGATAKGAAIPPAELQTILEKTKSAIAWEQYAWLGQREAAWVLEHRPDLATRVAHPLLWHIPAAALPVLLSKAENDNRSLNQHPDHPLRLIEHWIEDVDPGSGAGPKRRKVLLSSTIGWWQAGGKPDVALQAILQALHPAYRQYSTDPGAGRTLTWSEGTLTQEELKALHGLWRTARQAIDQMKHLDWSHLFDMIGVWVAPMRHSEHITEGMRSTLREALQEMLTDITTMADGHRGVLLRVRETSERFDIELDIHVDPEFATLFGAPRQEGEDWDAAAVRYTAEINALATQWSTDNPSDVASRLATLEREAAEVSPQGPRRTWNLAQTLATSTMTPTAWLEAFLASDVSPTTIAPFMDRLVAVQEVNWDSSLLTALANPALCRHVIRVTLGLPICPTTLLSSVLAKLPDHLDLVDEICLTGALPEAALIRLLQHDDVAVRSTAAVGEWNSEPQGQVRTALSELWQRAIRHHPDNGSYWFAQILRSDPQLAHDWLRTQIRTGQELWIISDSDLVAAAIDGLDVTGRHCILRSIASANLESAVASRLVNDQPDLYSTLLQNSGAQTLHLAPIAGQITDQWAKLVKVALANGISKDSIAQSVLPWAVSWIGSESAMWNGWVQALERAANTDDQEVRDIVAVAYEQAVEKRDLALAKEKREAVFGTRFP